MITQNLLYGALGAEYLSGIIRNIDRDQLSRLRTRFKLWWDENVVTDAPIMGEQIANTPLFHIPTDNRGVCPTQHLYNVSTRTSFVIVSRLSDQHFVTIKDAVHLTTRKEKIITLLNR